MSGEVKDFKADKIATAKQVPKTIVLSITPREHDYAYILI